MLQPQQCSIILVPWVVCSLCIFGGKRRGGGGLREGWGWGSCSTSDSLAILAAFQQECLLVSQTIFFGALQGEIFCGEEKQYSSSFVSPVFSFLFSFRGARLLEVFFFFYTPRSLFLSLALCSLSRAYYCKYSVNTHSSHLSINKEYNILSFCSSPCEWLPIHANLNCDCMRVFLV